MSKRAGTLTRELGLVNSNLSGVLLIHVEVLDNALADERAPFPPTRFQLDQMLLRQSWLAALHYK